MRRLETKEQANEVLKSYKKLATSCFGNDTIATAADILVHKGGRLGLAIDWMVAEGTTGQVPGVIARPRRTTRRSQGSRTG